MFREEWFATPVWVDYIKGIDNNKVIQECQKLKSLYKGRTLSNVGGWQSEDLKFSDEQQEITKLKLITEKLALGIFAEYGVREVFKPLVSNAWVNINGHKDSNMVHNHPNAILSAVYFVKANDESGQFLLHNDFSQTFINSVLKQDNYLTYPSADYKAEPGKILFFPAWIPHSVGRNLSKDARISIAFNIGTFNG